MTIKELVEKLNNDFGAPSYHVVAEEHWTWQVDHVWEFPRIAYILRGKEKIASLLINNWTDLNVENVMPHGEITWDEIVSLEHITGLNVRNAEALVGTGTLEDYK